MARRKRIADAEVAGAVMGDIERFELLMIGHWKLLASLGAAAVVAVGALFGVGSCRAAADRRIAGEFGAAETESQLEQVLARHPGHAAARSARLRLARLHADSGRFEDAARQYRVLAGSDAPRELRGRMLLNEASMLENAGKTGDAASMFESYARDGAMPASVRAEAGYSAGRLYAERKMLDKAAACLKLSAELGRDMSGGAAEWSRLARFLLLDVESGVYGAAAAAPGPKAAKQ